VTGAWIFFFAGLLCAIIYRILLVVAAFRISLGWGLGIFLPFGPFFFRLSYPDEAARSMAFRLGTMLCFGFSVLLGPKASYKHPTFTPTQLLSSQPKGYALEKSPSASTKVAPILNREERRTANTRERERLRTWDAVLRLRKRDLLRSDVQGNINYNEELAQYNAALAKATTEENLLATSGK
jgi:hypothetical protein